MTTDVIMPQFGTEIEEARIDAWLKVVGDLVTEGEALLSITIPKLAMEIEAPASGVLSAIKVEADEIASVAKCLASLH